MLRDGQGVGKRAGRGCRPTPRPELALRGSDLEERLLHRARQCPACPQLRTPMCRLRLDPNPSFAMLTMSKFKAPPSSNLVRCFHYLPLVGAMSSSTPDMLKVCPTSVACILCVFLSLVAPHGLSAKVSMSTEPQGGVSRQHRMKLICRSLPVNHFRTGRRMWARWRATSAQFCRYTKQPCMGPNFQQVRRLGS